MQLFLKDGDKDSTTTKNTHILDLNLLSSQFWLISNSFLSQYYDNHYRNNPLPMLVRVQKCAYLCIVKKK